jgi:hypothetical protein
MLLTDPGREGAESLTVLVELPGAGAEPLAAALLQSAPGLRRRMLPSPSPETPAAALRDWYRDAWMALSAAERTSVALVTGPTAAFLLPSLDGLANGVALVGEPTTALGVVQPNGLPKRRHLAAFAKEPSAAAGARLRPWSNPQSRALLRPWHDSEGLAVTPGPPEDADHWRGLLFEHVLSRVDVSGDAGAIARQLASALRIAPEHAIRAVEPQRPQRAVWRRPLAPKQAEQAGPPTGADGPAPVNRRHADLLRSLSWLDVELYACCSGSAEPRR